MIVEKQHPEGLAARISRRTEFSLTDLVLMLALFLFAGLSVVPALRHKGAVLEDAAMLLRYSQNLADHHGIRWNVGEHPVEGATDFLYMVSIAGLARILHQDAASVCRLLLVFCSLALPVVAFACCRFAAGANRWLAFALAFYIASSPSVAYVETGFGVPFMMLVVALTWWAGITILVDRSRAGWVPSLLFSLLALAMGLTRPEGNVLAVLMLLAIVFLRGVGETKRLVLTFAAVFVVVGGSYFLWRVHYYGYLLPNPFYVKGGGHLHLQGLGNAAENAIKITWSTIPLALTALRNRYRTRLLLGLLIPVAGFTLIWVLLSNENNHLLRFQMPLLPIVVLFLPLLLQDVFEELQFPVTRLPGRAQLGLKSGAAVYTLAVSYCLYRTIFSTPIVSSNGEEIARHLERYADRGYTMAVTEAGTYPYYSRWKAIDVLGLNDATIAHQGLDEAYLDRYKPELILYHLSAFEPQLGWRNKDKAEIERRDEHAIRILHAYAVHNHYILAAAYGGEPCSLHFFYVRPNTVDTDAIIHYLRDTPYYFLDTGVLSDDYRNGVRPECGMPVFDE